MTPKYLTIIVNSGMDTERDPKLDPIGTFASLENGSFDIEGAYTKRSGNRFLSTITFDGASLTGSVIRLTGSVTASNKLRALAVKDDELLMFNGAKLFSYSETGDAWVEKSGSFVATETSNFSVKSNSNLNLINNDVCVVGNYEFHAWAKLDITNQCSAYEWCVIDRQSRARIREGVIATAGQTYTGLLKCVQSQGWVYLLHSSLNDGSRIRVFCLRLSLAGGSGTLFDFFETTIVDQVVGMDLNFLFPTGFHQQQWDVIAVPGIDNKFFLTYVSSTLGPAAQWGKQCIIPVTTSNNASPSLAVTVGSITTISNTGEGHYKCTGLCAWADDKQNIYVAGNAGIISGTSISGLPKPSVSLINANTLAFRTRQSIISSSVWFDSNVYAGCYNPTTDKNTIYHSYAAPTFGSDGNVEVVDALMYKTEFQGTSSLATSVAANVASGTFLRQVSLASKPFYFSGSVYVPVAQYGKSNNCNFVLNDSGSVVSKILPVNSVGCKQFKPDFTYNTYRSAAYNPVVSDTCVVTTSDPDTFLLPVERQSDLTEFVNVEQTAFDARQQTLIQASVEELRFNGDNSYQSVPFRKSLLVPNSLLSVYDGVELAEVGFTGLVASSSFLSVTSSAGNIATGTYFYKFTYQSVDNNGYTYQSNPSQPFTVVNSGSSASRIFNIPTLHTTNKRNVTIVGWRTVDLETGGAGAGEIFSSFTPGQQPVTSSVDTDYTPITDNTTNSVLKTRPVLYSVSELRNNVVPVCSLLTTYRSRVVMAGDESDPTILWFSKKANASSAVSFNSGLQLRATDDNLPVTAIASLGNALIIFKQRFIYTYQGDGPDNAGGGTPFAAVQKISSDIGCSQPKSVVETPAGLIFLSSRGFYMLSSNGSLQHVGKSIERLTRNITISSAVLLPSKHEARFTVANSTTTWVYDYTVDRWHKHTHFASTADSVVWKDQHVRLTDTNVVMVETAANRYDGALANTCNTAVETGWISLSSLGLGECRLWKVWLQGEAKSDCTVTVQIFFDGDATLSETHTNTVTAMVAPSSPPGGGQPFPTGLNVTNQKCSMFKIRVSDSGVATGAPGDGYFGYQLAGIKLEVGSFGDKQPLAKGRHLSG